MYKWLKFALVLVLILSALPYPAGLFRGVLAEFSETDNIIQTTLLTINRSKIIEHLRYIASRSRYTGYPGSIEVANYIFDYFNSTLGLETFVEEYNVTIPMDWGSKIVILDPTYREIKAYALLPNNVQTCSGVFEGPLVYVGEGSLEELNGLPINGSIALMEFNSRDNWLNAMRLGAKAVVFIEPVFTLRGEAEHKSLDIPVKFPRIYISSGDAGYLRELIRNYGVGKVKARVVVNMTWERVTAKNIVAVIKGTDPAEWRNAVVVVAYYDSNSIVPALAPGANEAGGITALLEFARILKEYPPKRSVWLVALSGHAQAMAGARNFVWHRRDIQNSSFIWHYSHIGSNDASSLTSYTLWFAVGFDFSTESRAIAAVAGSTFYGVQVWYSWYGYNDLYSLFFTRGRYGRYNESSGTYYLGSDELREKLKERLGNLTYTAFGLQLDRRYLQTPGHFDAAVIAQVGIWGITFTTALTARPLYGTPLDTLDKLNFENLWPQVELSFVLARAIIDDISWISYDKASIMGRAIPTHTHFETGGLGFTVVKGRVGRWDIKHGWYNYSWHDYLREERYQMVLHVKILERNDLLGHEWVELADRDGTFTLKGLTPSVGWAVPVAKYQVLPFIIDKLTGDIVFAPDYGVYGTRSWPYGYTFFTSETELIDGSGRKLVNLAVFRSATLALHEFFDPRSLLTPPVGGIQILDRSGIGLTSYSYVVSEPPIFEKPEGRFTLTDPTSGYEAVVFVPKDICIKMVLTSGGNPIGLLINDEEGVPVSFNYLDTAPTILRVTRDLLAVVKRRVEALTGAGLMGATAADLDEFYRKALRNLELAESALMEYRYSDYYAYTVQAWYYALYAYEKSKSMVIDTGVAMVFFFLLNLPFVFMFERLVLHYEGKKRLIALVSIMLTLTVIQYLLHPGFKVASYSFLTALGATSLILVIPVMILMFDEFSNIVREIRSRFMGPMFVTVDRLSLTMTAISIGVENLRRRHMRTVLTIIGVTLVTFSTVSFVALSSTWVTVTLPPPGQPAVTWSPRYTGVLVTRREAFQPINPIFLDYLTTVYGEKMKIVPRVWIPAQRIYLFNIAGQSVLISGIIGLSKAEAEALELQNVIIEALSPWFTLDDEFQCYVTDDIARTLNLEPGDRVYLYGMELTVMGIIDSRLLRTIYDLDGQPIVPFDPLKTGPIKERAYWGVVYIPYKLAMRLGGYPFSVALLSNDKDLIRQVANELSEYIGFYSHNVYAATEEAPGSSFLYLRREVAYLGGGWQFVLVPMVISFLMLVSVVLGTLYERMRDMQVYATVGASPRDAAGVFFGEVLTYAFLSAPLGYTLGLALGPVAAGPLLNYASLAVVTSILVSILAVVTASVYPAYMASKIVVPSLERKWRPSSGPRGSRWDISLPFTVRNEAESRGLLAFIGESLRAYGSEAQPFMVTGLSYSKSVSGRETAYISDMRVRLRPYELGVEERIQLIARKGPRELRFRLILTSEHLSGPRQLWIANHLRFVDEVRKRLLVWRSLKEEDRKLYIEKAGGWFA
ncbi:MAG: M28 family peptidase [Thermofilaceae archaeon]